LNLVYKYHRSRF